MSRTRLRGRPFPWLELTAEKTVRTIAAVIVFMVVLSAFVAETGQIRPRALAVAVPRHLKHQLCSTVLRTAQPKKAHSETAGFEKLGGLFLRKVQDLSTSIWWAYKRLLGVTWSTF